jgi:hypothetical protein
MTILNMFTMVLLLLPLQALAAAACQIKSVYRCIGMARYLAKQRTDRHQPALAIEDY